MCDILIISQLAPLHRARVLRVDNHVLNDKVGHGCHRYVAVIRYVEAVSGQEFEIQCRVDRSAEFLGDTMTFHFYVDGQKVLKRCVTHRDVQRRGFGIERSRGYEVSATETRCFCFANLDIGSEEGQTDSIRVKDLGTIKVEVHHMWESPYGIMMPPSKVNTAGPGTLHEKALKGQALSHSIGLGSSIQCNNRVRAVRNRPVDPFERPAATYVFRYRSLDSLRAIHIIPRHPSPEAHLPLEDRDLDNLSQPELVALLRRERAAKARGETKVNIKREREDDGTRSRKKARPSNKNSQLELNDDGRFREISPSKLPGIDPEVIVLD